MTTIRDGQEAAHGEEAFGAPGLSPRWTHGDKDGIGTAYNNASRLWFTLWNGIVTELYYPNVDQPQMRDLQFLITDGRSFCHEESRDMKTQTERVPPGLEYKITNTDPDGRYRLVKQVIVDPHLSCLLQHVTLEGDDPDFLKTLKLYALCAPHLGGGGAGNNARVLDVAGRTLLAAHRNGAWLVMGATVPFTRRSCGYVGASDGWIDLQDYRMDWEFAQASSGNVALTAEIDVSEEREFTLGVALSYNLHNAVVALFQSLAPDFSAQQDRYREQWSRMEAGRLPLESVSGDHGSLFRTSHQVLLAHEDKEDPGAFIASLAIPWGEAKGDEDQGGYHLVWVRDMVNTVGALMAAGDWEPPLRALIYLAACQQEDGGFAQNFYVNGEPYWSGLQIDEVALPIVLGRRMRLELEGRDTKGVGEFDFSAVARRAAGFLVRHGPVTEQERWEEASGYSPSSLASVIAACVSAAHYYRRTSDENSARFLEEYADWLESHLDRWTVAEHGTLLADTPRHYVRVRPAAPGDPQPVGPPDSLPLTLANQPPDSPTEFPCQEIVDCGFLELVRYGIRRADDPLVVESLKVVDATLKVDTPFGPAWRRYPHDGYGQRPDGGPYTGWGRGRAWPLLTGERGHYALAAGQDPAPYLRALEAMASGTGLLPEQCWDEADRPEQFLFLGRPTGSAMPLAWAHSEYLKLLRSTQDGHVFDRLPEVSARYADNSNAIQPPGQSPRWQGEMWNADYPLSVMPPGVVLRVLAAGAFRLHWSADDWATVQDTDAAPTPFGLGFVDIPVSAEQRSPLRFTFYWPAQDTWEGHDYEVEINAAGAEPAAA